MARSRAVPTGLLGLKDLQSQHLANILWAFARVRRWVVLFSVAGGEWIAFGARGGV